MRTTIWAAVVAIAIGGGTFETGPAGLPAGQQLMGGERDWPMWRHDPAHTSQTAHQLPDDLTLHWSRHVPAPQPAWPESQFKLDFDRDHHLVCADGKLVYGSTADGSITAVDVASGKMLWQFFTDGPVRFSPVVDNERVLAVSDDGRLYCLDLASGQHRWSVLGGPERRHIIGNNRLGSMWPARGGVVVHDGKAYFAAGIWPSLGVFIRAVDVATGAVLWTNSTTGSQYVTHPHNADSFGTISPQGHLAIEGDHLIVPGGRTLPAVFDLASGELVQFTFGGKGEGGHAVLVLDEAYVVRGELFETRTGKSLGNLSADIAVADGTLGKESKNWILTAAGAIVEKKSVDRRGKPQVERTYQRGTVRKIDMGTALQPQLVAGETVFASQGTMVYAYRLAAAEGRASKVWESDLGDNVLSMIVANERLIVATAERISCFGATATAPQGPPRQWTTIDGPTSFVTSQEATRGEDLSAVLGQHAAGQQGYALSIGVPSDATLRSILGHSELHVIVAEPDSGIANQFRRRVARTGWLGTRLTVVNDDTTSGRFPPYIATLAFCEQPRSWSREPLQALYQCLRPYGGALILRGDQSIHQRIESYAAASPSAEPTSSAAASFYGAAVERLDGFTAIYRRGPLKGAGVWTHQNGDASASSVSQDDRVKTPLGLLWFGGPPNDKVLPRHGHGPTPQVAGGRLVIEGADMLRCVDVYTGRVWWEREFPGLGAYYDNTAHHPGAGEIGSNYVTLPDSVYVIYGDKLLSLDATTGQTVREFQLPGAAQPERWGSLLVEDDRLVVTGSPVAIPGFKVSKGDQPPDPAPPIPLEEALRPAKYSSASRMIYAFDRHTGALSWARAADRSFRHNAICAADGKLFCIDALSPEQAAFLRRRGVQFPQGGTLLALDLRDGELVWHTTDNVFGTFLNYSREHGILLQGGSAFRDRAADEIGTGMVAYRGETGEVVWSDLEMKYNGPCLLLGDRIITNGNGGFELELLTGRRTGWSYTRMYGCNTAVGSKNLLTFRSGAAGFFDLAQDSGTGNFGGFRSSCTSNLIVADGVLNAPDYTRTCVCAYQMQASLALIHMPDVESWTFGHQSYLDRPVAALGINLAGPGDRRDDAGTLWFDFPAVGGPSPKLKLVTDPATPKQFAQHSSLMERHPDRWIAASGLRGVRRLQCSVPLTGKRATVQLVFSEPDNVAVGERVFSVYVQGQEVVAALDIAKSAEGPNRTIVRDFADVLLDGELTIELKPQDGSLPAVISGIGIRVVD